MELYQYDCILAAVKEELLAEYNFKKSLILTEKHLKISPVHFCEWRLVKLAEIVLKWQSMPIHLALQGA